MANGTRKQIVTTLNAALATLPRTQKHNISCPL
jgi:hypothetical protein